VLWQSLQRLHGVAGFTDESRHIACVVLYSMTNKVKSQAQMFSQSDHASLEWVYKHRDIDVSVARFILA
jgi:hypothetical protein